MSEDHALWEAIGNLRRAQRDLLEQLVHVVHEGGDHTCSFCHAAPPEVTILEGPDASICDRCIELCVEILELDKKS